MTNTNGDSVTATNGFLYFDDWIILNDAPESAKVRRDNSAISIHDVLNNAPNTAQLLTTKPTATKSASPSDR